MSLTSLIAVEAEPLPRMHDLDHDDVVACAKPLLDEHFLRACAWEIGERHNFAAYSSGLNHVGLAMASPGHGYAYWKITQPWVDTLAQKKGDAWRNCRLVLRLYDVSYIEFTGLNAHHIDDRTLPAIEGQMFFDMRRPGTWQIAEVGFLLRNGEFIPAARSQTVRFARIHPAPHGDVAGLLVTRSGKVEDIGNVWDQERILHERRQPKLRRLRIAIADVTGADGFVARLAGAQCSQGHEVHLFVPSTLPFEPTGDLANVKLHRLPVNGADDPVELARAFGSVASKRINEMPRFDLLHTHEWMTGQVTTNGHHSPKVLSLSSIEATRRNGSEPSVLSRKIEEVERQAVRDANLVLAPHWLIAPAAQQLKIDPRRICQFPMAGRVSNEWDGPLDYGQVKMGIQLGPLDRVILFVGSLEHATGPDILLEAMPVLLQRAGNLRLVFAGGGSMHGHLQHRAHQLGVAHAVRLLGHVEQPYLIQLLRSAEALMLPSRYRVPFDDAVVDLARRAGRAVVTTHGGPAHLVRHEETGLITYDNPNSMVWAVDRIMSDPGHTERMGQNGKRWDESLPNWQEVARRYFELCSAEFPQLTIKGESV